MNLRAWNSNSAEFLNNVNTQLHEAVSSTTILGLKWNTQTDLFTIADPEQQVANLKHNMKEILKDSAQLYDPMGWMSPVSVRAKLLLRKCHEKKYTWNSQLTKEESKMWTQIYEDLQRLT